MLEIKQGHLQWVAHMVLSHSYFWQPQ